LITLNQLFPKDASLLSNHEATGTKLEHRVQQELDQKLDLGNASSTTNSEQGQAEKKPRKDHEDNHREEKGKMPNKDTLPRNIPTRGKSRRVKSVEISLGEVSRLDRVSNSAEV
jgi:hypothetical protein